MENQWRIPKTPHMRDTFRESSAEAMAGPNISKQNNRKHDHSKLPSREPFDSKSSADFPYRVLYVPLVEPKEADSIRRIRDFTRGIGLDSPSSGSFQTRCATQSLRVLNEQKLHHFASVEQMYSKTFALPHDAKESSKPGFVVDGLINDIYKSLRIEEAKLPTPSCDQVPEIVFGQSKLNTQSKRRRKTRIKQTAEGDSNSTLNGESRARRGCPDTGKMAIDLGSMLSLTTIEESKISARLLATEAASAPKPNPQPPPPLRILKRTDPIPGVSRESNPTIAKGGNKPSSVTRSEMRLQRAHQNPRGAKQQLLAEERKARLLSRFRRTLEAATAAPAVAVGTTQARRCVEREFPRPKRPTRLKAGIMQDRIRRRALGQTAAKEAVKFVPSSVEKANPSAENADAMVVPKLLTTFSIFVEEEACSTPEVVAKSKEEPKGLSLTADEEGESETTRLDRVAVPSAVTAPKSHIVEKIVLVSRPDLEESVKTMVSRLADFHDRSYKQTADSQAKRKNNRRIVCGFHEVIKSLKLNRLKFLVVAKDLEKGAFEIEEEDDPNPNIDPKDDSKYPEGATVIPPKSNALAKTLKQAVDMAKERNCPVMLAFKRRQLQKMCHKGAPVSCVGVINCAGAEDITKNLFEEFNQA